MIMEHKKKHSPSKESEAPKAEENTIAKSDEKTSPVESLETSIEKTRKAKRKKCILKEYRKSIAVAVVAIALFGAFYHYKGLFIAAMVDGQPISRLSVIKDVEKRAGEQALDALITKKLIDTSAAKANIIIAPADIDQEIKKITEQVAKQGGTLAAALEQQGMTEADLRDQLLLQKELERLLGDKVAVTDAEVDAYVTTNKASVPSGMSAEDFRSQIREQLKGQKFSTEAEKWVADAKAKADIRYYADHVAEPAVAPATK